MSPDPEERAKGVDLPAWWLEKVRELVDVRKDTLKENLTQLGVALADAVGREEPWDHSSVSRFLRNKNTTVPMAEAFAQLLQLPRPFFVPRSLDEALSLQQIAARYDAKQLTPEQQRRLGIVDQVAKAAHDEANHQTRRVALPENERASRRGRSRRAPRGRPPTS